MDVVHFDAELNFADGAFYFVGELPDGDAAATVIFIMDGSPSSAEYVGACQQLVDRVPRFRQRLRPSIGCLTSPTWVDTPLFEIADHVAEIDLATGSTAELLGMIDGLQDSRFLPDRPPWSTALVRGLEGGRAALVLRLHHSLTDGTAMIAVLASVFSFDGVGEVLLEARTASASASRVAATARTLAREWRLGVDLLSRHLVHAARSPAARGRLLVELGVLGEGRRQRGRAQHGRRSWILKVPVDQWRETAHRRNGGVNELFVALAGTVWAEYIRAVGEPAQPVRVAIPVDLRDHDAADQPGGNTLTPSVVTLDGVTDYLADLSGVRALAAAAIADARAREAAVDDVPVLDAVERLLPGVWRGRMVMDRSAYAPVVATNLMAPPGLRMCGRLVEEAFALGTPTGGAAVFALLNYRDAIQLTVNVDTGYVRRPAVFADCLQRALKVLGWTDAFVGTVAPSPSSEAAARSAGGGSDIFAASATR